LPLSGIGALVIYPIIEARNMAWWNQAMTKGVTPDMEGAASNHLSTETKRNLESAIHYSMPGKINPSAIVLMYHNGVGVDEYVPLPAEVARDIVKGPGQVSDSVFARNPSLPSDVMEKLSQSNDLNFLQQLCYNSGLSNVVAREMLAKFNSILSVEMAKSPPARDNSRVDGVQACLMNLAGNPNMPADILRELAAFGNPNIIRKVANNRAIPGDTAMRLMQMFLDQINRPAVSRGNQNTSGEVPPGRELEELAANPGIPAMVFDRLAAVDDLDLMKTLAANLALPDSAANVIADKFMAMKAAHENDADKNKWGSAMFEILDGLRILAQNRNISIGVMRKLSTLDDPKVLEYLAEAPSLPDDVADILKSKFDGMISVIESRPFTGADYDTWDPARAGLVSLEKRRQSVRQKAADNAE